MCEELFYESATQLTDKRIERNRSQIVLEALLIKFNLEVR